GQAGVDADEKAHTSHRTTGFSNNAACASEVSQSGTLISAAEFDLAESACAQRLEARGVDVIGVAQGIDRVEVPLTRGLPQAGARVRECEKGSGTDKRIEEIRLGLLPDGFVQDSDGIAMHAEKHSGSSQHQPAGMESRFQTYGFDEVRHRPS